MTSTQEALTRQLLAQLPHYTPGLDWMQVFRAAKKAGETDDYSRFLADEHCRITRRAVEQPLAV